MVRLLALQYAMAEVKVLFRRVLEHHKSVRSLVIARRSTRTLLRGAFKHKGSVRCPLEAIELRSVGVA